MKASWLSGAHQISDKAMNYLRRIAVQAAEEKGCQLEGLSGIGNWPLVSLLRTRTIEEFYFPKQPTEAL